MYLARLGGSFALAAAVHEPGFGVTAQWLCPAASVSFVAVVAWEEIELINYEIIICIV